MSTYHPKHEVRERAAHGGGREPDHRCDTANRTGAAEHLRRALSASEARFQAIVDRSADGVVVVSTNGVIRFVNPGAERLLGRRARSLLGEVFGVPIVPGEVTEIDLLQRKGRPRAAEMRVTETEWQGERAYLATLRDVTERKRREEEAREGVRRRDLFLAALSHELRNPLGAIVSASHVLRCAQNDEHSVSRARDVIDRQSQLMKRLLDDLLDVARISCGKIELRPEPIDLREILHAAAGSVRTAARERNVRVEVVADQDKPLPLRADSTRLSQVLVNLLTNAVRYNKSGGFVHLSAETSADEVIIRVTDNGIGIPPDKLENIFEPFQQGDVALDRQDMGLGIGLALVYSLVHLHGGRIEAHSDGPHQGSAFTVYLPLMKSQETMEQPRNDSAPGDVPEHRILVVEDNESAREMLKSLLELEGHDVAVAADAHQALEVMDLQTPEVALVDIGLPKVDGIELARRIRREDRYDQVFLIALTGYGQAEDRRQTSAAGFDAHLVKPLDFNEFSRLLSQVSRRESSTPTR